MAGDCLHETEHVLGAMVGLTHEKIDLLLSTFARGNVLHHADEIVDRPVVPAHAADGPVEPDERPVSTQTTLVDAVAADLALAQPLNLRDLGCQIIRVCEILK